MEEINVHFVRVQIFQNNDQYQEFEDEVKTVEKYNDKCQDQCDEQILKNVTQYYAWIQFNFQDCLPLNILINAIATHYLDVKKAQIKNIAIAILENFIERKKKSLYHGKIESKNIIIEFKQKQQNNQTINDLEIKQIYFTNYCFQEKNENQKKIRAEDEKKMKEVISELCNLIDNSFSNLINDKSTIEDILYDIKRMNIQEEKQGWKSKIKGYIPWGGKGQIQSLSQKIKQLYPELEKQINVQITQFIQPKSTCTSDSVSQQSNESNQISQTSKEDDQINNKDQQEDNIEEKKSRIKLEEQWKDLIQKFQNQFLQKLKELFLSQFVENLISELFSSLKQQIDKQNSQADNQTEKQRLEFKSDKYYINATNNLEIQLKNCENIQETFKKKWKDISDEHYKHYKFDFDLNFQEQVEQHFYEFFAKISNSIYETKNLFDTKMQKQIEIIKQQFDEKYDQWISYKILDLISSLI